MAVEHVLLPADAVLPLLSGPVSDIAACALVMGDPARVERAAALLSDAREVGRNREYLTISGRYNDMPVTVASHGVGSAGAAVCFEELLRAGVRRIVRAGTAGGLQPDVTDGDLVIATGAVRDEGTSLRLVPLEYPAVADPDLVGALTGHAWRDVGSSRVHRGVVLTGDLFYPTELLGSTLQRWADAGVCAVEMELSVLLVLAGLRGVAAAGVFAIDGNPMAVADMTGYSPHRAVVREAADAAVRVGLEALTSSVRESAPPPAASH